MEREDEFFKIQYQSLREEIKETKNRAYRTLTIGFAILPGAELLGDKIKQTAFIAVIPILIITFAMIFLSQNHEIMRCGRFIRICIEPRFKSEPGWETYLESEKLCDDVHTNTRTVDRYLIYAFYGIFFVYYLMASFMAIGWIHESSKASYMSSIFALSYTVFGIGFGAFLNRNLRSATTTDAKQAAQPVVALSKIGQTKDDPN